MTRTLRTLLASVTIAVAGTGVLVAATDHFQAFTSETARRVAIHEHPVDVPEVMLQTQTGALIDLADLHGRWLLVDFIYTRCPSLCLALGTDFARLQQQLAEPIAQDRVMLLSISFDPDHDTPDDLEAYLRRSRSLGNGWLAARPVDSAGLRQLIRRFGVIVIPDEFGGYTHNAAIHIVDPQGQLVEILDQGDPQHIARIIERQL